MGNNNSCDEKLEFVCFRCDRPIKPGEKMLSVCVSLETPITDGSIDGIEVYTISTLCFGCASVFLTEAVLNKKLTMPTALFEETEGKRTKTISETMDSQEGDILVNLTSDEKGQGMLKVHCSKRGFYLTLRCPDGISWANSQLFTWQQIAQLLIAADPDMFGVLDEPLHQVFPQTLASFGYSVPNWREQK